MNAQINELFVAYAVTAVSMSLLSSGLGLTLSRPRIGRSFGRLAPALGVVSLVFGVWYALGSQSLLPYVF